MAALNEQQKYLLNRLPNRYDVKTLDVPEPAAVKAARKVIEAHDKHSSKLRCDHQARFKKVSEAAREAIYFKKPEEALKAVQQLESEFQKKCEC